MEFFFVLAAFVLVEKKRPQKKERKKEEIEFLLNPIGVLAPGSAHARPSTQPPST